MQVALHMILGQKCRPALHRKDYLGGAWQQARPSCPQFFQLRPYAAIAVNDILRTAPDMLHQTQMWRSLCDMGTSMIWSHTKPLKI